MNFEYESLSLSYDTKKCFFFELCPATGIKKGSKFFRNTGSVLTKNVSHPYLANSYCHTLVVTLKEHLNISIVTNIMNSIHLSIGKNMGIIFVLN